MAKGDNPSVGDALKRAKDKEKQSLREQQEQRTLFKGLMDRMKEVAETNRKLNKLAEEDPFNKESFVRNFLGPNIAKDFVKSFSMTKLNNLLVPQVPKMKTVTAAEIAGGPIIDHDPFEEDIAQENTQLKVLQEMSKLNTKGISNLIKPFIYMSRKMNDLYSKIRKTEKIMEGTYTVESEIRDKIAENNEIIKTLLIRQFGPMETPKADLPEGFMDRLKMAFSQSIDLLTTNIKQAVDRATPQFMKGFIKIGKDSLGVIGIGLNFIRMLINVLNPFKKLFLAAGALSFLFSMFNFIDGFSETGEKISALSEKGISFKNTLEAIGNLFSVGLDNGFKGLMENFGKVFSGFWADMGGVRDIFSALWSDIASMFTFSEEFKTLIGNIVSLYTDHLMPLFRAFLYDFILRFYDGIKSLFASAGPAVEQFNQWYESGGGESIANGFKTITHLIINGLNILFGTVLPPVIDALTKAIKAIYPIVVAIGKIVMNFIETTIHVGTVLFKGLYRMGEDLVVFVQDAFTALQKIVSPENWLDFLDGIEDLLGSIVKLILNTIDNIITTIFDLFKIDELLGMKDGERFSEAILRFFNWIGDGIENFFDGIRESFFNAIDEGIEFVKKYHPMAIVVRKIMELFDYITSIIPSASDIYAMVKKGAKDILPDFITDRLFGDEPPSDNIVPSADRTKQYQNIGENAARNAGVSVTNNVFHNSTTNNQNKGGSSGRTTGTARTTAIQTPNDRLLFGGVMEGH